MFFCYKEKDNPHSFQMKQLKRRHEARLFRVAFLTKINKKHGIKIM